MGWKTALLLPWPENQLQPYPATSLNVFFQDSDLGTTIGEFVEGLLSQDKWPSWPPCLGWFQVAKVYLLGSSCFIKQEVSPFLQVFRKKSLDFSGRPLLHDSQRQVLNETLAQPLWQPCLFHAMNRSHWTFSQRLEGIEGDRRWGTWWVPNALLGVAKWPARCGMPMKSWKQIMTFSWHQKLGGKGCWNHLDAVEVKLDQTVFYYCIYIWVSTQK